MRVHQSFLNDCLLALQYNRESSLFYGGSVRALGTGYHKALEHRYIARRDEQPVPPVSECLEVAIEEFRAISGGAPSHSSEHARKPGPFKWNERVPDLDTAVEHLSVMVPSYFEGNEWPEDWKVLAVELDFELPWYQDHTRGGQIDLVLEDPAGFLVGDDQKTAGKRGWNKGKEHPRKNPQANWYGWAMQELYPGYPGYRFVFSIMKYSGQFERRVSDPTFEHIAATSDLIQKNVFMYELMRGNGVDMPANPQSNLCSPEWCDFWNICPHGEALDT